MNAIPVTELAKQPRISRRNPLLVARRQAYQRYCHLLKVKDSLIGERQEARKHKRLDEVQFLTEAIFNLSRTIAHLQTLNRRRFHCDLEDLQAYK